MADLANEGRGGAVGGQLAAGGRGAGSWGSPRVEGRALQVVGVRPHPVWVPNGPPYHVVWSPARFLAAAPASASARPRGSSAAPRPLPTTPRFPASHAALGAQRALRCGPAASGWARPPGLLAGPARHAPFPASLAWGPSLQPRPGLRSRSPSSRRCSATPACGLHPEVCLNPSRAPLFPPLSSRSFKVHLMSPI